MDGFSVQDIMNLNKLLNSGQEDEVDTKNQFYSVKTESVLNPSNLMRNNGEKKEIARPFAKIEAKSNRNQNFSTDIWTDSDFKENSIKEDGRPKPQFDFLYKQNVGTEDVYLGMSEKSNSSLCCDQLLLKIYLPNTNLKEISLEVKEQSVHLQTPNYLLNHILPYIVDKDNSNAKWDKEKGLLLITVNNF